LSGVRRSSEIMLRQTGKRMKMTSMCRTWAEPRAIATSQRSALQAGEAQGSGGRTEGVAEGRTSTNKVVFELIVNERERKCHEVQDNPHEHEQPVAA
jgi:hypothetical protein